MNWQTKFDRLLKAMASGEPPKRKERDENSPEPSERDKPPRG
ncbi:hypothetical protein GCM10023264_15890 [Sphingomonas daechungensis]